MNTTLQRRFAFLRAFVGTRRGQVTAGITLLVLVAVVAVAILLPLSSPRLKTGIAPDGPGDGSTWAPTTDTMVGTSLSSNSRVWFTGGRGVVTAAFFPSVDTVNSSVLELLVGDRSNHWADEERADTTSQTTIYDPHALAWKVVNTARRGAYTIQKVVYADPSRDSITQDVIFTVNKGHLSDYQLYVYYNPAMHNTGDSNFSSTRAANGLTALVTTNYTTEYASAVAASLPYVNGRTSSGFVGQNDGLADLKGTFGCGSENCPDYRMTYGYQQASKGNTAQIGELDLSNGGQTDTSRATKRTFRLVFSFGKTSRGVDASNAAMKMLGATLKDSSDLLGTYVSQWHAFDQHLTPPPAVGATADVQKARQEEYYLAINLLKASQDKQTKAFVAGLGNPWGPSHGDNEAGGYHLVWMRDMYKVANALIVAGDSEDAKAALQWAFTTQQQADGHFPQNSMLDGTPYWNGIQMDEQAFPLALAWRLGLADKATYLQHIKPAAEYIIMHGPDTGQERWEENRGYSPSTIAAEIAGLICAAAISRANGDSASATQFQAKADEYQRKVESWTFTTSGPLGNGHYYLRLTDNGNPNAGDLLTLGNSGGVWDQREVVDAGFLELVRLGVKSPHDPAIVASLAVVDSTISETIDGHQYWFRYNHDGYGEDTDGLDYSGSGRGRLWPLLSGERGIYAIAAGQSAEPYLDALMAARNSSGFIPEQIWDEKAPGGTQPGTPTRSMSPLDWSMAEYVVLLFSASQGRIVDIPSIVQARYAA